MKGTHKYTIWIHDFDDKKQYILYIYIILSNIFLSNQKINLARFFAHIYVILSLQFVKGCMFIDDVDDCKIKDNIPIELFLQNMTYLLNIRCAITNKKNTCFSCFFSCFTITNFAL